MTEKDSTLVRAPEGFVRVQAVADAPWFVLEEGNVVQGKLLGVYVRDDKRAKGGKSKFFQVELTASCTVRAGRGEDVEVFEADPGEIVNLNYTPMTKVLEDFTSKIRDGGVYEVYAHCGAKTKLANGNTMWKIETFVRTVSEPPSQESDLGDEVPAGE